MENFLKLYRDFGVALVCDFSRQLEAFVTLAGTSLMTPLMTPFK